jgi:alpha-aminoadipic semialdehyde synthase
MRIGIRREDKHAWERRVPLTPDAVAELVRGGIEVAVQSSPIRVFDDASYRAAGAEVSEELASCDVVLAVKEVPLELLRPGGAYVFFSHTIKGQAHNMPLLRRLMELGCTLIDYERIVDDAGQRLVFFGRHAGLAGMIDTLWVLGRRLEALGTDTPLASLRLAHEHTSLDDALAHVQQVGQQLARKPLPAELAPLVIGVAGYGNVSQGAQTVLERLPIDVVEPEDLATFVARADAPRDRVVKVVFREEHLVERTEGAFDLQEYYREPEHYRSIFPGHAAHLSVLVNAIYWTDAYPRLVDNALLRGWWSQTTKPRLLVIGDISCDIEGAVECTVKATTPGAPAYVYDPHDGTVRDGVAGPGVAMMTTDCLPCELPREASGAFTEALLPFVAQLADADLATDFASARLPDALRRATILWHGELTADYAYMKAYLA